MANSNESKLSLRTIVVFGAKVFGGLAALSLALKLTNIGDISAAVLIIVEWYRWLVGLPFHLIRLDIPEALIDIIVALSLITSFGMRKFLSELEKPFSIRTLNEYMSPREDVVKWRIISILILVAYITIIGQIIGGEIRDFIVVCISILLWLSVLTIIMHFRINPKSAIFSYIFVGPLLIFMMGFSVTARFILDYWRNMIVGLLLLLALLVSAALLEHLLSDQLDPYLDQFPRAPEAGQWPSFKLPPPS